MRDLNSCVVLKGLQFCPKKLHEKYDFCQKKKKKKKIFLKKKKKKFFFFK